MTARRYIARFERIGRHHHVPPLVVEGDPDEIAFAVFVYARDFLKSKTFEVVVDLDALTGEISGGRFGSFELTPE